MSRTIVFVFAGRQPNIEVALPYYQRIIDQHPDVELHIWDLARDPQDSAYLRTLSDRFTIRTDFYEGTGRATSGQTQVWKHYATPEYRDTTFVKLDDDVLFLETDHFDAFVQAAHDNPKHVTAALTINNGASTRHIPDLWDGFQKLRPTIPSDATYLNAEMATLLAVHRSPEYAEMCHRWFFDNWRTITGKPTNLIVTDDWVSINAITYSWEMGCRIAALIGRQHPPRVAGRVFSRRHRVGDEGAANILPRFIHTGFVAGHLNFGPQVKAMAPDLLDELRKHYADIAQQYLA